MEFITNPTEIEVKSFEMISELLGDRQFDPNNINVIKRVIHTSADFDYADNLVFSENAVAIGKEALKNGANIVTDTQMGKSGINKAAVAKLGCELHCFIDSPTVADIAKASGLTRARTAVDWAIDNLSNPIIFVVGNAPTALIRLYEQIKENMFRPDLIIAVPVGFINVVESKELILELDVPHIVGKGRKGGSNIAAAICNAMLYEITDRD
jgi:precorrin-8X/cobalt-precorrin-8 methylmutase